MLTNTEKSSIRTYLGYPDLWRYRHTRLESVLENCSPEAETQIRGLLDQLAVVDAYVNTAATNGTGNLKKIDTIEFFPNGWASETSVTFRQSRSFGRHLISRLSIILGVPPYGDYYGGSGWPGDSFFGSNGGMSGGGGPMPLG